MEIFEKISTLLTELVGTQHICLEHKLQEDLALDSLQMVTLLMMVEENFDIVLNESDMNPFDLTTVEQVVNLVKKYIEEKCDEKTC